MTIKVGLSCYNKTPLLVDLEPFWRSSAQFFIVAIFLISLNDNMLSSSFLFSRNPMRASKPNVLIAYFLKFKNKMSSIENLSSRQLSYDSTTQVMSTDNAVTLKHIEFHSPKETESRPPAIFLHGLLGNKRNFATIARSLSAQLDNQRSIYGLDLRNHGMFVVCSSS